MMDPNEEACMGLALNQGVNGHRWDRLRVVEVKRSGNAKTGETKTSLLAVVN